jgi:hypothetical protein
VELVIKAQTRTLVVKALILYCRPSLLWEAAGAQLSRLTTHLCHLDNLVVLVLAVLETLTVEELERQAKAMLVVLVQTLQTDMVVEVEVEPEA